jgi:hypothetical protein
MQMTKTTLERRALTKIARKLQAGHAKETTGDVTPWTDLADEERKLWMRLAQRAVNATLQEMASASESGASQSPGVR